MAKVMTAPSPVSVRFGKDEALMLKILNVRARASGRSVSEQVKHYIRLATIAEDNPDLPLDFIQGVLEGLEESRAGLTVPYQWGVLK